MVCRVASASLVVPYTRAPSTVHHENPCVLGAKEWTKSEVATSPLPSRGPKGGQNCYVTLASLGSPRKGNKIRISDLTPAFSGMPRKGHEIRSGCITHAFSGAHIPKPRGLNVVDYTYISPTLGAPNNYGCAGPNECHWKKNSQMVCLCHKTPLKPPRGPFLKRGGFPKPPTLSDF